MNIKIITDKKEREAKIYKVTIVGAIVNFVLILFKFVAGIFGNSGAMIADAVHSLSDFVTDFIVIVFVRISNKPKDKNHDYGHGKYETLATVLIGCMLIVVGGAILWSSILKIIDVIKGEVIESPSTIALYAAIVSIVFKEILYRYTVAAGKKCNSKAVMANAWHHRSDALSSFGTAIGISGAILLGNQWTVLDPIAAVIVGLFIIKIAVGLLKTGIEELLEKSLPDSVEDNIASIISSFDGVENLHNLRTRKIGNDIAIDFHICMNGDICIKEAHKTTIHIETEIRKEFGDGTLICIHIEPC